MLLGKGKSELFQVSLSDVISPKGISLSQPYCPLVVRIVLSLYVKTPLVLYSL